MKSRFGMFMAVAIGIFTLSCLSFGAPPKFNDLPKYDAVEWQGRVIEEQVIEYAKLGAHPDFNEETRQRIVNHLQDAFRKAGKYHPELIVTSRQSTDRIVNNTQVNKKEVYGDPLRNFTTEEWQMINEPEEYDRVHHGKAPDGGTIDGYWKRVWNREKETRTKRYKELDPNYSE